MRVLNPNPNTLPQIKIKADLRIYRYLICDSIGGLRFKDNY
jgi:hypothetical protein